MAYPSALALALLLRRPFFDPPRRGFASTAWRCIRCEMIVKCSASMASAAAYSSNIVRIISSSESIAAQFVEHLVYKVG